MTKDSEVLGEMNGGTVFGELAILYNCKRTASVKGIYFSTKVIVTHFMQPVDCFKCPPPCLAIICVAVLSPLKGQSEIPALDW